MEGAGVYLQEGAEEEVRVLVSCGWDKGHNILCFGLGRRRETVDERFT